MVGPAEIASIGGQVRQLLVAAPGESQEDYRRHADYLAASAWRYAVTLDRLRHACGRSLEGATVLDVGAYPGHLAALLGTADRAHVIAVTLMTSGEFEAQMRRVGVTVVGCDVEQQPLPAADGSVAAVLCCELIEHLDGDVRHMLREARRVVREDGLLLLTTPNHASMAHRWALLRGRSVYPRLDDPDYPFYAGAGVRNPMRHVREFTAAELACLLDEAGFRRIEVTSTSPPLGDGVGLSWRGYVATRIIRALERVVSNAGNLLLAVARP